MRPKRASAVVGLRMLPMPTSVSGSPTTRPALLKADEGDKQADAAGHRGVKLVGNGAQNHLPDAGGGESEKNNAGEKDRAQGRLPGNVHLEADGVSEVGVQAHARRQRDGIARHHAHENGAEGRGQAGGRGDRGQRHSGSGQDGRIDQHDIGHGQKRGDAGQNLGAPVGSQARKFKIGFKFFEHRRVSLEDYTTNASQ